MTKIGLDRSGIDAVVRQLEAAGVFRHGLRAGWRRSHCELFVVRSYPSQVRSGGHFHLLRLADCAFNEPSVPFRLRPVEKIWYFGGCVKLPANDPDGRSLSLLRAESVPSLDRVL
jgi:hypothetical protein